MNIQERQRQFNLERPTMRIHDTPQRLLGLLRAEVDEVEQEMQDMHPRPLHKATEALSLELADCLIYLLVLANYYDLDLLEATQYKISYNEQRFPKDMFAANAQTTFETAYGECKQREFNYKKRASALADSLKT